MDKLTQSEYTRLENIIRQIQQDCLDSGELTEEQVANITIDEYLEVIYENYVK